MITLTIDQQPVTVAAGATILHAARQLGISIPTLCYDQSSDCSCQPQAACRVCLVFVNNKFIPACCTAAAEGMIVESETPRVHDARRAALELLFSVHRGDCFAPCQVTCPAHLDIPTLLRLLQAEKCDEAAALVHQQLIFPATLGHICFHPCHKACRRGEHDDPLAIRDLHRFASRHSAFPPLPPAALNHHEAIAVLGATPAGIAAAVTLRQLGYPAALFDAGPQPGNYLQEAAAQNLLPLAALQHDLAILTQYQIPFYSFAPRSAAPSDFISDYRVFILAADPSTLPPLPLPPDKPVCTVEYPVRPLEQTVFAVADGRKIAYQLHARLSGRPQPSSPFSINSHLGKLRQEEFSDMLQLAASHAPAIPDDALPAAFTVPNAAAEAHRCLHCDCRKLSACRLRLTALAYHANPRRYPAITRPFQQIVDNAIIFEPAKCIACGLCVRLTSQPGHSGMIFTRRGIHLTVAPAPETSLAAALGDNASQIIAQCPTGALSFKT